jgi:hypothetical protein
MKHDNPFYYNYLFSKEDINRRKIKWWMYPFLWFKTTYIQVNDGYLFKFKIDRDGCIYLMETVKLKEI